jgi:hypothetical protein
MLTVREEQFAALREGFRIQFESELASEIAQTHARFSGGNAALEFVRAVIGRAERFGFTSVRDIARFANIAATLGLNFDEDPRYRWARIILADRGMEPRDKISRLSDWTRRTLKKAASARAEGTENDTDRAGR